MTLISQGGRVRTATKKNWSKPVQWFSSYDMAEPKNHFCLNILNTIRFVEKCIWHEIWVSFFSTTSVGNIFLLRQFFSELRAETHVDLRVKRPFLLSDSNQNLIVLTDFSKRTQYRILWISVQRFSSCYMWQSTDRYGGANRCIF
jgi:hypothetical protein